MATTVEEQNESVCDDAECDQGNDCLFQISPSSSSNGGLGLISTQFIAPGTVILTEEACLVGPSTPYACIECLAAVISTSDNRCPGCGHALCANCR